MSVVPQGCVLYPVLFSLFINNVCNVLPPDGNLLYADDIKIFLLVSSSSDCLRLQHYLNAFVHWCLSNLLRLCPEKCSVTSFSHSLSPILFNYTVSNSSLSRVMSICALAVILDSRLNFKLQLGEVLLKANRYVTLGFILRFTSIFGD